MKMLLWTMTVPAVLMAGCATGNAWDQSRHTSSIWQLDRDATRDASVEFTMERTAPDQRDGDTEDLATDFARGVYGTDVYLELVSDGTYTWQSGMDNRRFVSTGSWEQVDTRSGTRVYLKPDASATRGPSPTDTDLDSWLVLVDSASEEMRILIAGHPGPVLRRVD